jgi:hypothetical protein
MPNRILREGILTSPRMRALGWPEEVFYRRLLSVVDDFGRYYADLGLLRAACYPRQLNKVSDPDIGKWLSVCETAGLVRVYPAEDGERYVEVFKFGQQVRAKKSKYPNPLSSCVADASQVLANAHLDVSVSVDVDESASADASQSLFELFWKAYPSKVGKDAAKKAFDKRKVKALLLEQMLMAIEAQKQSSKWKGGYVPNPATWLNEGRWQDETDGGPTDAIGHFI